MLATLTARCDQEHQRDEHRSDEQADANLCKSPSPEIDHELNCRTDQERSDSLPRGKHAQSESNCRGAVTASILRFATYPAPLMPMPIKMPHAR